MDAELNFAISAKRKRMGAAFIQQVRRGGGGGGLRWLVKCWDEHCATEESAAACSGPFNDCAQ